MSAPIVSPLADIILETAPRVGIVVARATATASARRVSMTDDGEKSITGRVLDLGRAFERRGRGVTTSPRRIDDSRVNAALEKKRRFEKISRGDVERGVRITQGTDALTVRCSRRAVERRRLDRRE
jgi:hypothetical protein